VADDLVPDVVAAVTRAALEHGATHVSLHVSQVQSGEAAASDLPADGGSA
jgi:hypothetical protein